MHKLATLSFVLLASVAASAQQPAAACTALTKLTLPYTTITLAEQYPAGAFPALPGFSEQMAKGVKLLPEVCRVVATIAPTPDSAIRVETWMPAAHWNGRFRGGDNGGFAGALNYQELTVAVLQGYAAAGTDTGHTGSSTDATWALNHPEKIADFGYRGIHEMTVKSKEILKAYYGTPATHAYFAGCSDGGREALMEAQRFPTDYDGILAGAPAYNWTALVSTSIANAQALTLTPTSYITTAKIPAISKAALATCDASDGLKDGILNDPRSCHFDPNVLLCKQGEAESNSCLNPQQITALKALYGGSHTSAGKPIWPGYLPGSEEGPNGWASWITGAEPGKSLLFAFGQGYFPNMVYNDPSWKIATAKVEEAYTKANEKTAAALNATDTNLSPFFAHGGKLILYHGWNDPAISALGTIDYFGRMNAATPAASSSARLYMVPGMQHCGGGSGPDSFGQYGWFPTQGPDNPQHDLSLALQQWVEQDKAPTQVIATKYAGTPSPATVKMTRPLCPYPQSITYNGTGDPNTATSFSCSSK